MRKFNLYIILMLCSKMLFSQVDTIYSKEVKGFVFIPAYNPSYDYKKGAVGEISPSYNDYFFPVDNFNINLLLDSNIEFIFKNGLRIEVNNFHNEIKQKAYILNSKSLDYCYYLDTFYIVPVTIKYKLFEDRFPKMCSQSNFQIKVMEGSKVTFSYRREAIIPINIKVSRKPTVKTAQ